jgi:hypothetical protein
MKLFNAIAAITAISASFVTASPARGGNGWMFVTKDGDGKSYYIKPRGCIGSLCLADVTDSGANIVITEQYNCSTWNYRFIAYDGEKVKDQWESIMPRSVGEAHAKIVCR